MSTKLKNHELQLFIILSSVFIASLVSCNLIFQKFFSIEIWVPFVGNYTFEQSVGLLPYPITFLVTDIISEVYGQKRANQVVLSGLIASLFMLFIVSAADFVGSAAWSPINDQIFSQVFGLSSVAVFASMIAYLFAQFIDVRLFHFWKNLTKGKHLWLRNNASTILSQCIDTFSVLFLLCYFGAIGWEKFWVLFINGFLFKIFFAAFDTPFFYLFSHILKKKFGLKLNEEVSF